jgi:hypothetical protein
MYLVVRPESLNNGPIKEPLLDNGFVRTQQYHINVYVSKQEITVESSVFYVVVSEALILAVGNHFFTSNKHLMVDVMFSKL